MQRRDHQPVGITPGVASDITARLFTDKFTQSWGTVKLIDILGKDTMTLVPVAIR